MYQHLSPSLSRIQFKSVPSYQKRYCSVTDETWKTKVLDLSHKKPVIVDFWANWCGPCHMLAPVLESASKKLGFSLVKYNVDESNEISEEYKVSSIPYVIVFSKGKPIDYFVGYRPEGDVKAFLEKIQPKQPE